MRHAYDVKERRVVDTKSAAGRRAVPVPAVLRDYLVEHRMRSGERRARVRSQWRIAIAYTALVGRARRRWLEAQLAPITLHECRHAFASLMIAEGVNAKALSRFMGHANIAITFDRYGHLMPGSETECASLLDVYLDGATTHVTVRIAA